MTNQIIDEVREARAAISKEHGYDRAKILAWARAEQAARKANGKNIAEDLNESPPQIFAEFLSETAAG